MMRIAACGLLGLGSALIIAALLLSTYTSNRLAKIPLDWDATLVSEGKGRALDPASLSGQKFIADPDRPLALQEQISTVSPADATKVGLQAGITLRRTDKQGDAGLVLATVDTVTVDRHSAEAISSDDNPGGSVQKPRAIEDETPPTTIALKHEGLSYRFPFDTEDVPVLRRCRPARLRRQLHRRRGRQRAHRLPLHPERRLRRERKAGGARRLPLVV